MYITLFADLEEQIRQLSINVVLAATVILVILIIIASLQNKKVPRSKAKRRQQNVMKIVLFGGMALTLVMSTAFLFGSTVYLNTKSESKGPVHWHTDIEFWACGQELELRDPQGALSNKIGTSTYHEHNDKRIHLEGVVVTRSEDSSLGKFMQVADGQVNRQSLVVPLNEPESEWLATPEHRDGDNPDAGNVEVIRDFVRQGDEGPVAVMQVGDKCDGEAAEVQAFQYTYDKETKTYEQKRLSDPAAYIMRDESVVPPGDCVIVEFDKSKDTTDKLCEQYGVRDAERCVQFGVHKFNPDLCNIREVRTGEDY